MKRREYLPYAVSPEQIRAFSRLPVEARLRFVETMARLLLEVRREETGSRGEHAADGKIPERGPRRRRDPVPPRKRRRVTGGTRGPE